MSLISRRGLLQRIRRGRKTRAQLVASNLSEGIAFQIRATRDKCRMTQEDLALASGMTQNNLSRLESPDYGKQTISSLKRIADALDVALVVRFVPFSQYIDWLSGTPRLDEGLNSDSLAVDSFEQEEQSDKLEWASNVWMVNKTQIVENRVSVLPPPIQGEPSAAHLTNLDFLYTYCHDPIDDILRSGYIKPYPYHSKSTVKHSNPYQLMGYPLDQFDDFLNTVSSKPVNAPLIWGSMYNSDQNPIWMKEKVS